MKKLKKFMTAALALAMTASLLSGCGGSQGNTQTEVSGKGRYVEEDYGSGFKDNQEDYAYPSAMTQLSDGTIRMLIPGNSETFDIKDSTDGGKTWAVSSCDTSALNNLIKPSDENHENYISQATLDAEGDIAFIHNDYVTATEGTKVSTDETMLYYFLSKDGELKEIPLEIPGIEKTHHYEYDESDMENGDAAESSESEEDDGITINQGGDDVNSDDSNYNGISTLRLFDANTLYVSDYNGAVYCINVSDGQIKKTINDMEWVSELYLCGDKLLTFDYNNMYEYDAATGEKKAEHEELAKVFREARSSVTVANYLKDNKMYYVSNDGIYTYDFSSKKIEQIVDGNMSSLVSPNSNVSIMVPKADGDILVYFNDYSDNEEKQTLLNFSYDPEAPKRPDKSLRIYSLQENYLLRTIAASYQKSHPDIYISVEYGMSGDNAVTTSDAIRTLNTEIMASEGPDIVFMQRLSIDSYVEKGLFADMSELVNPMISDGTLFETIANTYKTADGKIYAIPTSFAMPIVFGYKSDLDQLNSLSDFATLAEQFAASPERKENQNFSVFYNAVTLPIDMMSTNSASWFNEDHSLNTENLKAYLSDIKKIYDANYSTFSDEEKSELDEYTSYIMSDANDDSSMYFGDFSSMLSSVDPIYVVAGNSRVSYGAMLGSHGLREISSAMRKNPELTYKALPGALENVYIPSDTVAINAKTKDIDSANAFIAYLLSEEGQKSANEYGSSFSINTKSFDDSMIDPRAGDEDYNPDESYGGYGMTDFSGKDFEMEIYWPTQEHIAQLKEMINQLKTPAYSDSRILTTIWKDSIASIVGSDLTIDEAVEKIVKDINIYLSE